jgi:hypothetical protein
MVGPMSECLQGGGQFVTIVLTLSRRFERYGYLLDACGYENRFCVTFDALPLVVQRRRIGLPFLIKRSFLVPKVYHKISESRSTKSRPTTCRL